MFMRRSVLWKRIEGITKRKKAITKSHRIVTSTEIGTQAKCIKTKERVEYETRNERQ